MKIQSIILVLITLTFSFSCRKDETFKCEVNSDTLVIEAGLRTYTYTGDGKLLTIYQITPNSAYGGNNTFAYAYDSEGMLTSAFASFDGGYGWHHTKIYRTGNLCAKTFEQEGIMVDPLDTTYFWINNELDFLFGEFDTIHYSSNGNIDSITINNAYTTLYAFEYNSSGAVTKVSTTTNSPYIVPYEYNYTYNNEGYLTDYTLEKTNQGTTDIYHYDYNSCGQLENMTASLANENNVIQSYTVIQEGFGRPINMSPSKFWRQRYLGLSPVIP